ncbi:MAG: VanZ family protein [Anaerolineae bacterium]|uniref:VanZ family protein n=1 Tax=Promineifilum sp. TaxID=2664178 RepID=UPI001DE86DD8|nr:VanZ family protein [Anaerolineales bacterium]MCB8935204.1 VanZ family protein [Promineifilum sp.]MCO5179011.1 VanZ family protein [Promineifilum sp.]MCW5846248.1 VanZ family protein [Anaerolineae bacterium]
MTSARIPGRWVVVVSLLALATILYLRLIPFSFVWPGHVPFDRITWQPLNLRDAPLNVLLFVPFGFGISGVLARRGRRSGIGSRALLGGLALSVMLETTQMFIPERVPSLADVMANGIGALLGYGFYRAWEMGFGRALDRYATRRNLLLGLAVYALGAGLLTAYLYRSVHLSNWDASFPLVVGNEAVGKRQWSGRVERLELAVGRLDNPQYVARYDFMGEGPFADAGGGPTPSLDWRDGPATPQTGAGVQVGPGEWLATDVPFSDFITAARGFNSFTIRATVASDDPQQRGPARIVSVSADAERRNVTIGQEKDALIIRLRTPTGGENGQKPEILLPGVFGDGRPRQLVITYDAPMLQVSVDDDEYTLSLAPGAAFFPGFQTANRWPVTLGDNPRRYDWAYWAIVIGLGVLLFGGLAAAKRLTGANQA